MASRESLQRLVYDVREADRRLQLLTRASNDVPARDLASIDRPETLSIGRNANPWQSFTNRRCEALQTEVLDMIFNHLDCQSLCACGQVASEWRRATFLNQALWRRLCELRGICGSGVVRPSDAQWSWRDVYLSFGMVIVGATTPSWDTVYSPVQILNTNSEGKPREEETEGPTLHPTYEPSPFRSFRLDDWGDITAAIHDIRLFAMLQQMKDSTRDQANTSSSTMQRKHFALQMETQYDDLIQGNSLGGCAMSPAFWYKGYRCRFSVTNSEFQDMGAPASVYCTLHVSGDAIRDDAGDDEYDETFEGFDDQLAMGISFFMHSATDVPGEYAARSAGAGPTYPTWGENPRGVVEMESPRVVMQLPRRSKRDNECVCDTPTLSYEVRIDQIDKLCARNVIHPYCNWRELREDLMANRLERIPQFKPFRAIITLWA